MEKISLYRTCGKYFFDEKAAHIYETLYTYKDIIKDIEFYDVEYDGIRKINIDELFAEGTSSVEYFQVRSKTAWDILIEKGVFEYTAFMGDDTDDVPQWDDNFANEIWYWDNCKGYFTCHYWTNAVYEMQYTRRAALFPAFDKDSFDESSPEKYLESLNKVICTIPGTNSESVVFGDGDVDWTFDEIGENW